MVMATVRRVVPIHEWRALHAGLGWRRVWARLISNSGKLGGGYRVTEW
jgi:hypothetical protein